MSTNPTPPPLTTVKDRLRSDAFMVINDLNHEFAVCTGPNAEQNAKAIAALPGLVEALTDLTYILDTEEFDIVAHAAVLDAARNSIAQYRGEA